MDAKNSEQLLRQLIETQSGILEQLEHLVLVQKELLTAQNESNRSLAALLGHPRTQPSIRTAGCRLVNTFELLEMILLELPMKKILFAQRVCRQFQSVISGSAALQRKLFFTSEPDEMDSAGSIMNPFLAEKHIFTALPVYFDDTTLKLAYLPREGRRRIVCESVEMTANRSTGQPQIRLEFGDATKAFVGDKTLKMGSWKRMHLARTFCGVEWQFTDRKSSGSCHYSGVVTGAQTWDELLDGLAASPVSITRNRSTRRW